MYALFLGEEKCSHRYELQGHCCLSPTRGNTGHSELHTELRLHLFPSSQRHVIVCYCSKSVSGDTGEWDRAAHPQHPYSGSDGPPFSNLDNVTAGNAWRENLGLICMWVAGTDHSSGETELVGTVKVPEGKMWLSSCWPQFTEWWTGLQQGVNRKHSRSWGL